MSNNSALKIHVFYCVNAFEQGVFSPPDTENVSYPQTLRVACSAMVKDVYILKAFECGADGVMVVGCPAGKCKRVDGNIRAAKRVAFVQKILDEVGLGGKRLVYTSVDDLQLSKTLLLIQLAELGPRQAPGPASTPK